MSNKKNKINNPLKGIATRSLIITLVMIFLFIACGFGLGYGVRGCVDQRENQALTASAEASSVSSEDYTTFQFNLAGIDTSLTFCVSLTFLNHSLSVYPDSSIPVFSIVSLNPSFDTTSYSLTWDVGSNVSRTVSYADVLTATDYPFGGVGISPSFSVNPVAGRLVVGNSIGNLEDNWELLYVQGFYKYLDGTFEPFLKSAAILRPVYSNGFSFVIVVDFSGTYVASPGSYFDLFFNGSPNFVFYNTSETGLTAEAYERGKLAGMADLEDQVREARLEGYNNGRAEGEDIGYQRGLEETLEDISPFNVIVSGVNSFLRTEILPGVQLTIILSVGFGLLLLGFAIKVFLGG